HATSRIPAAAAETEPAGRRSGQPRAAVDRDALLVSASEAGEEAPERHELAPMGDGEDAVGRIGARIPAEEGVSADGERSDVAPRRACPGVTGLAAGAGNREMAARVED